MKSKIIIPIFFLCLLLMICSDGCVMKESESHLTEPVQEIVLTSKYLDKCGITAEEWLEAHYTDEYTDYSIRDDGALILKLTDGQRFALQRYAEQMVEKARDDFEKEDPDFKVEVSEDYRTADFYYYPTIDKLTEAMCMSQIILYGCAWQIYDGCGEDEWAFEINIYNCRTGRPVTSGGTEKDIRYSKEDWE